MRNVTHKLADDLPRRPHRRLRAETRAEVIVSLCIVAFVVAFIWLFAVGNQRPRISSRRAVCASNLRGIGQTFEIYQDDHGTLPRHYFETTPDPDDAAVHGVDWIGAMGSHASLRISQETSPTRSPKRNSVTRAPFLLISEGRATPGQFICPESPDREEDDFRNFGSDATNPAGEYVGPGKKRFDFRGYPSISYGFSIPFGPATSSNTATRPPLVDANVEKLAFAADKGPFIEAADPAIPDTKTTPDRPSKSAFPGAWSSLSLDQLNAVAVEQWKPFNTRNHEGEGQVVLFGDGHAEFVRKPLAGINGDNIYTINPRPGDILSSMLGLRPADAPLAGPRISTDAYIVP